MDGNRFFVGAPVLFTIVANGDGNGNAGASHVRVRILSLPNLNIVFERDLNVPEVSTM